MEERANSTRSINWKLETGISKLRKSGGLSLVELVVFIVIVSAAVAGIIGVISITTQSSADPVIRKQALAIAEAFLEEVQLQPFTYCDPDDPGAATADLSGGSIAFATVSTGNTGEPSGPTWAPSLTFSHTVPAGGANRILVVGVNIFESNISPVPSVSTMTYAGQSMTLVAGVTETAAMRIRSEMWYIIAPATGANDVVITFGPSVQRAVAGAISYTGVHQTTPIGTAATAFSSSVTPSVAVSSATGELVVATAGIRQAPGAVPYDQTLTPGAGQTQRYHLVSGTTDNGNVVGAGSEEAGAASVTMSWTAVYSRTWAIVAAPLKPAGGCPTLTEAMGPESGETRYSTVNPFDNVNDYHGFDSNTAVPSGIRTLENALIPGLDGYRVTVSVTGQPLGAIGNDAYGNPRSLLITVTVTGPGNTTVALNGYRTRYAPNALP